MTTDKIVDGCPPPSRLVPPPGSVMVICRDCTGPHPADAQVIVFPDDDERARWRAEHRAETGHRDFWLLDEPMSYAEVLATYAADLATVAHLGSGRPLPARPTFDSVLAELTEAQAHPEWRNAVLSYDAVTALLDGVRALTEPLPEIPCPHCEATIRARLADREC